MLSGSMAAVGLIALANSTRQGELASHAYAKYARAIREVNTAIASPAEFIKDSTLMAVISLLIFEAVSGYQSWLLHVQAAAALVVARGKGQFSSPLAIHLFNQVRTDLITSCVNEEISFHEEMISLQEEASKHTDISSPCWLIGVLGTRCARLLATIRKDIANAHCLELLDEVTMLKHELKSLLEILAVQEPYETV